MLRIVSTAVVAGIAALAVGALLPALADVYDDLGWTVPKVRGITVSLGQVPGGASVASAATDRAGTMTFFNLPEGRYQISIDASKLTKPAVVKVQAGRDAPVTSAPVPPAGRGTNNVVLGTMASVPLSFVVPPGSGAPRGATPKAVAGPAPRDANPLNTIAVTVVDDLGAAAPK